MLYIQFNIFNILLHCFNYMDVSKCTDKPTEGELMHEGFCEPPSSFTYRIGSQRRDFFKINSKYFDRVPFKEFKPENYFKESTSKSNAFREYASNPKHLEKINAIQAMDGIRTFRLTECTALQPTRFGIFCANPADETERLVSMVRMKLFCAFGKLNYFIHQSKFKLIIRGGMALRLQLKSDSDLRLSASKADIDGLVVVDKTVSRKSLNKFKIIFIKLLISSVNGLLPPKYRLTCRFASGDKNTIKIMLENIIPRNEDVGRQVIDFMNRPKKALMIFSPESETQTELKLTPASEPAGQSIAAAAPLHSLPQQNTIQFELADIGFKYSYDEVVEMYDIPSEFPTFSTIDITRGGVFSYGLQVYPNMLPCMWHFTTRNSLKSEYENVSDVLMAQSRERHLFDDDDDSQLEPGEKFLIEKFQDRLSRAIKGFGGKKRTMKRRMRMRGGSTTEQIGTAAQMRTFLPRNSTTRNALNHIVHHEDVQNKYYDPNYQHDNDAQTVINNAFRLINANSNISRRTKKKMMIAKKKSARAR